VEERVSRFEPFELVYDWESAVNEARRCLRCGMGAEITDQERCASCLTCLRVCPYGVPHVDEKGRVVIPPSDCVACGICVTECPAKVILLRRPSDRRHIEEGLNYLRMASDAAEKRPTIVGFACQYGLFGTGSLSPLFSYAKGGLEVIPVLCVGKVEVEHIIKAFELGTEGVFIAGCGQRQCARERTLEFAREKAARAREIIGGLGLEVQRVEVFDVEELDIRIAIEGFIEKMGALKLERSLREER
jgi:coenzyme F420-reducing hydrogenase delta subunit/NAD-dependent dihydropyrimidine dehydrogenase PreA subunit